MIIISTKEKKKIPYHNKVTDAYKALINSIHEELLETNPVISGSNAIKYIYSPKTNCNDIDLYFQKETDYQKAYLLLKSKHTNIYESKNASSFNDIKVQLIKKNFLCPSELILSHDLVNVACAITSDKIYTTQKTHFAWYNEEIVLQNFQVSDNPSIEEIFLKLNILISRIIKYQERYQLSLSNSLKKFLYEKISFLKENKNLFYTYTHNEIVLDYYGRPITETFYYSYDTLKKIKNLLLIPDSSSWQVDQEFFC